MRLDDVLAHLPEGAVSERLLTDPGTNIYTVSFIAPGMRPFRDDVLYFGEAPILSPENLKGKRINLVLFDVEGAAFSPGELVASLSESNVVVLSGGTNAHACYNALQALFLEEQAQIGVIRRMMMAHFSNKGIAYLVDEAAKALENPIDVIDSATHHIAYSMGVDEADMTDEVRDAARFLMGDTLSEEQVAYISREGIDSELARTQGPLLRFNHVLSRNTMTKAVMVNGVCIAFVMLVELNRPFRDSDVECFDRFAGFVGQELQKSDMWQPAIGEMGSTFLANLLGNDSPSEAVTMRRIKAINFHPRRALYILCFHAGGEGLQQPQAERIADRLRPFAGQYIYTRYHQNLVVLYSQDSEKGLDEKALHLLGETALLDELSIGISNPFERVTAVRKAYVQARAAIRLGAAGRDSGGVGEVFNYSDHANMHLLELASRRNNLSDFCHPALLRLMAHDAEHGTELMDTLYCYLLTAGSNTRAAEMLNLHKNSMLYRMGRIAEMLNLDLSSGEDRFALMGGFHILIYLDMFKPRITPRTS